MRQGSCADAVPPAAHAANAIDRELLRRLQADQASAMEEVIALHWAPLIRYVSRIVESMDSAEDIVQEACIELWSRRHTCDTSVRSYLYRTARNKALNESRRRDVRSRLASWVRRERTSRRPPTPAEVFEGRELEETMARALAELPERRREVFRLVRYHGMSYRETAEIMQISPQTVANQMSAALAALRTALERSAASSPDDRGTAGQNTIIASSDSRG